MEQRSSSGGERAGAKGRQNQTGEACSGSSGSYRNEETDHVVIKLVAAILSYPPFYVCIPTACLSQDGVSDDMKYIRTLGYKIRFLDQGLLHSILECSLPLDTFCSITYRWGSNTRCAILLIQPTDTDQLHPPHPGTPLTSCCLAKAPSILLPLSPTSDWKVENTPQPYPTLLYPLPLSARHSFSKAWQ